MFDANHNKSDFKNLSKLSQIKISPYESEIGTTECHSGRTSNIRFEVHMCFIHKIAFKNKNDWYNILKFKCVSLSSINLYSRIKIKIIFF